MARRTFFSFHYQPDIHRAQVVRNSWLTKPDRESSGFFDSSVFESKKRTGDEILKRFLREALDNTSVTCVLMGAETFSRRWVRYEAVRSFFRGNGLLGIKVAGIKNMAGQTAVQGPTLFDHLAFVVDGETVRWKYKAGERWLNYTDVPTMRLADVRYNLGGMTNNTFACLFKTYDWTSGNGYANLGSWVESAAKQAGR